jgi:hypothetical protein
MRQHKLPDIFRILHTALHKSPLKVIPADAWHFRLAMPDKCDTCHKKTLLQICQKIDFRGGFNKQPPESV